MPRTPSHVPRSRARTDTARLDWLETWCESIDRFDCKGKLPRWRVWSDDLAGEKLTGSTLRDAIDEAMTRMEEIDAGRQVYAGPDYALMR
jgi:hypothetical protein